MMIITTLSISILGSAVPATCGGAHVPPARQPGLPGPHTLSQYRTSPPIPALKCVGCYRIPVLPQCVE
eukprot:1032856-Rhodomonas_salina.1